MTDVPRSFDWVEKRAKCNVGELFGHLRAVVEADVKSACRNISATDFEFKDGPASTTFAIFRYALGGAAATTKVVHDVRSFRLSDSVIEVFDRDSRPVVMARAALVGDDDCLIEIPDRRPMRLWEFSRLVLEDLFFAGR